MVQSLKGGLGESHVVLGKDPNQGGNAILRVLEQLFGGTETVAVSVADRYAG